VLFRSVLSELRPDSLASDDVRAGIETAPYDHLVDRCVELCRDDRTREALAERGYETFKKRSWLNMLGAAVQDFIAHNPSESNARKHDVAPPRKLNIGSGKSWKYDHFNIDIDPKRGADLVCDIGKPFAFDAFHDTWRFGLVRLPRGHFEYILSEHVFEHVPDLIACMTNCLEWLKDGGILEVEVPYDLSFGAWQDPTHVRAFNERSWAYYTEWCWYVGWRTHRFDLISQIFIVSESGQPLSAAGATIDELARVPRAIDALRVKLQKRALSDAEKNDHLQFFREVT